MARCQSQDGRRRGLPGGTHTAVRLAIRSGRIAEAVGEDGRIDPELADRLWDERTRHALRADLRAALEG